MTPVSDTSPRYFRWRRWLAAALCLVSGAAVGSGQDVLVLGRISDDPQQHYAQLKPLLDYVVARMGDVGIREGRILMARDAQQMKSYLRRGRVDWVTETPAMAVVLEARAGARPLLRTERGGVDFYHSVFIARRDSGLTGLADLRGRSVAFQNTASTSAYFAPAAALGDAGLPMEILLSPRDRPSTGSVGYVFARTENNLITWVRKRVVDAGAISNLDWQRWQRRDAGAIADLQVVAETPPFPRAIELVRGDLPRAVERRLSEVLLAAAADPDADEALQAFFGTNRFHPVGAETERALQRVRAHVQWVRTELE